MVKESTIVKKDITSEILEGLSNDPKNLPCKLFYDERGSELFDQICELEEYYLTRTEMKILENNIDQIAALIGKSCILIELGSGNSKKTRLLFDHLKDIKMYVPVDISREYLEKSADAVRKDYPWLKVVPRCIDFTEHLDLKLPSVPGERRIVFYPGSTIGNFTPEEAGVFLKKISHVIGENGGLLIGVDLKKNKEILQKAYNDSKGITALFNLNIIRRLNREFGTDFNQKQFRHKAVYNENLGRIEMYLISLTEQTVRFCDSSFRFRRNERVLTEYSYKYSIEDFKKLAGKSMRLKKVWTDDNNMFSIQFFDRK